MKRLAVAAGLVLAGCVTTPTQTYTADGSRAFYMECRWPFQCFKSAEATCGGPYRTISMVTNGSAVGVPQPNGGTIIAPSSRTALTFACQ